MSQRMMSSLEPRRLMSGNLPFDLPGVIDPGDIENFNGVRIDASAFPNSAVTVQVTSRGQKIALPMLRDGVVTAVGSTNADNIRIENRNGIDPTSTLPGIVFFDGVESGDSGVQIFGSVAEAVSGIGSINASLDAALEGLRSTRDSLAAMGIPTAALDAQLAEMTAQFDAVRQQLGASLTTPFVRVTAAGLYDAYFLASEVTRVDVDAGNGNDTVTSNMTSNALMQISGGAGNDSIFSRGSATLNGDAGNDRLTAGAASRLSGGVGNDILVGSAGVDTLIGGAGDDVLDNRGNIGAARDLLDGGAGRDRAMMKIFAVSKEIELWGEGSSR